MDQSHTKINNSNPSVSIQIQVCGRSEERNFTVSLDVLRKVSPLFKSMYAAKSTPPQPLSFKLPNCDPNLFETVALWLKNQDLEFDQYLSESETYTRRRQENCSTSHMSTDRFKEWVKHQPTFEPRWRLRTLVVLWLLARKLQIPKLQNSIMTVLKPRVEGLGREDRHAFLRLIFNGDNGFNQLTKRTPLRALALAQMAVGPKEVVIQRYRQTRFHRDGFIKELREYCDRRTEDYPGDKRVEEYFVPVYEEKSIQAAVSEGVVGCRRLSDYAMAFEVPKDDQ